MHSYALCIATLGLSGILLFGCGSSEGIDNEGADSLKTGFQTRMDTIATRNTPSDRDGTAGSHVPQTRFMVQIGAFRNPENASAIQNVARSRFQLPIVNEYSAPLALYQIRVGFFETKEAAYEFKARMQKSYPRDYRDAWVVEVVQ